MQACVVIGENINIIAPFDRSGRILGSHSVAPSPPPLLPDRQRRIRDLGTPGLTKLLVTATVVFSEDVQVKAMPDDSEEGAFNLVSGSIHGNWKYKARCWVSTAARRAVEGRTFGSCFGQA